MRKIAGPSRRYNLILLIVSACAFAFVFFRELDGTGISSGTYFRAFGIPVYILVFLAFVYLFRYSIRNLLNYSDIISIDNEASAIRLNGEDIEFSEIKNISLRRHFLIFEKIVFQTITGRDIEIRSFTLEENVETVLNEIRRAVST
jgi:hypothetical protein